MVWQNYCHWELLNRYTSVWMHFKEPIFSSSSHLFIRSCWNRIEYELFRNLLVLLILGGRILRTTKPSICILPGFRDLCLRKCWSILRIIGRAIWGMDRIFVIYVVLFWNRWIFFSLYGESVGNWCGRVCSRFARNFVRLVQFLWRLHRWLKEEGVEVFILRWWF